MKAEHRKELHTNLLADRMGRLVQGMKSGSKTSRAAGWVIAVLAVVVFVLWYWNTGSSAGEAALWAKLYNQANPSVFDQVAREAPGTVPARTADFQRARVMLQTGLENLYSSQRDEAVRDLEMAGKLYRTLRAECRDNPVLTQETLLGLAKAEEALAGARRDEDKPLGSLDQAVRYYKQYLESLARTDPQAQRAPLYKSVEQHVQVLEGDGKTIQQFYADLNQIAEKSKKEDKPPMKEARPDLTLPPGLTP